MSKDETDFDMNKKNLIAPITLMATLLVFSTMSTAQALFTKAATDAEFEMSQAITYYLRGSFNDGANDATYRFVNCTAEMTPEVGKIKEYKLENKALAKNAQFRVYASNDVYFKNGISNCSYVHHWSNEEAFTDDEDKNYIVPMTSNSYNVYLKFYDDGSSQVYITANKDILFFIPSNDWKQADAEFVVNRYSTDQEGSYVDNIAETSVSENTHRYDIGSTYGYYKFIRRNSLNPEETYNYSSIMQLVNDDTNNCFSLNEGTWSDWGAGNGSWSTL